MSPPSLATILAQPQLPGLDFLRMVAVLSVLLGHLELPGLEPLAIVDGVLLFFVLSGFLITWILLRELAEQGTLSLAAFYRRRAARLLPLFFAYLVLGYAVLTLRGQPVDTAAIVSSAFYLTNYYQGLNGAPAHYLSHCWSLSVEEQFYLLWPLALLGLHAARIRLDVALTAGILAVWLWRAVLMLGFDASEAYLYRALETRADHLLVGCLLAVLLQQPAWLARADGWARRGWAVPLLIVLLALSGRLLQGDPHLNFGIAFALDPVLLALLIPVVLVGASTTGWTSTLLNLRPAVLIGQVSYGMYLMHPFVTQPIYNRLEASTGSMALGVVAAIAGSFGLAYLSWRYVESPLRARFRDGWRTPRSVAARSQATR